MTKILKKIKFIVQNKYCNIKTFHTIIIKENKCNFVYFEEKIITYGKKIKNKNIPLIHNEITIYLVESLFFDYKNN